MTPEEKAKAYDRALAKARGVYNRGYFVSGDLEYIFPELKESEDERIRKALIDYFDDANKADENPLQSYGIHSDKAIAWLEKQGEHKHNWCEGCNNAKGCVACVDGSEWAHIEEHNSAWSEEDEERLNSCLNILQAKTLVGNTETINTKWLKSLKQRLNK